MVDIAVDRMTIYLWFITDGRLMTLYWLETRADSCDLPKFSNKSQSNEWKTSFLLWKFLKMWFVKSGFGLKTQVRIAYFSGFAVFIGDLLGDLIVNGRDGFKVLLYLNWNRLTVFNDKFSVEKGLFNQGTICGRQSFKRFVHNGRHNFLAGSSCRWHNTSPSPFWPHHIQLDACFSRLPECSGRQPTDFVDRICLFPSSKPQQLVDIRFPDHVPKLSTLRKKNRFWLKYWIEKKMRSKRKNLI